MSSETLIDNVISIEQEARNVVKEARSKSDSQISEAYEKRNSKISEAEREAREIRKNAIEEASGDEAESKDFHDSPWKQEIDDLAKKNFKAAVKKVLDRGIDYVSS